MLGQIEVGRERPRYRLPERDHQPDVRAEGGVDPLGRLRTRQVVGADLTDDLVFPLRAAELRPVPPGTTIVVAVEEVEILRLAEVDLGMTDENLVQPSGARFTRSYVKEVWQQVRHNTLSRHAAAEQPGSTQQMLRMNARGGMHKSDIGIGRYRPPYGRLCGIADGRPALAEGGPREGDLAEHARVPAGRGAYVRVLGEHVLQRQGRVLGTARIVGPAVLTDVGQRAGDDADLAGPGRPEH